MKKNFFTLSVFVLLFGMMSGYSQYTHQWSRYKLKFKTSFQLEQYDMGSDEEYGLENDDYAIDTYGYPIDDYNRYYQGKDIKNAAMEIAGRYTFENIKPGGPLPLMKKGYYVICEADMDDADLSAIVIVVVALDEVNKRYIESTIYCYNKNKEAGIEVAKSFTFYE